MGKRGAANALTTYRANLLTAQQRPLRRTRSRRQSIQQRLMQKMEAQRWRCHVRAVLAVTPRCRKNMSVGQERDSDDRVDRSDRIRSVDTNLLRQQIRA